MANFSENRNFFKPPPAPPDNFFRSHPRRRAFIAPAEPGDEHVVGLATNDGTERERRLSILENLGFGLIVVVERASPFDAAGRCWHLRTPILIHCEISLDGSERVARELADFESRTYVLPDLNRLSGFEFWHRHWREEFLEDGRLLIGVEDLLHWARPCRAEMPRTRPAPATPRFRADRLQLHGAA